MSLTPGRQGIDILGVVPQILAQGHFLVMSVQELEYREFARQHHYYSFRDNETSSIPTQISAKFINIADHPESFMVGYS